MVLRHAQAVPAGSAPDHARTLTAAGEEQAVALGRALRSRGLVPDLVVTSDAARARRTAELVVGDDAWPVLVDPEVYEASPSRLGLVLERAGVSGTTVLVCHEPGASGLAVALAGPSAEADAAATRASVMAGLGTAEAAVLRWGSEDPRVCTGAAELVEVLRPDPR